MPNVLIRDVPADDLEQVRAAALARGISLQAYLREAVHAQAKHLRRQEALSKTADRLQGHPGVQEDERDAVLDAVDAAHDERSKELSNWSLR